MCTLYHQHQHNATRKKIGIIGMNVSNNIHLPIYTLDALNINGYY